MIGELAADRRIVVEVEVRASRVGEIGSRYAAGAARALDMYQIVVGEAFAHRQAVVQEHRTAGRDQQDAAVIGNALVNGEFAAGRGISLNRERAADVNRQRCGDAAASVQLSTRAVGGRIGLNMNGAAVEDCRVKIIELAALYLHRTGDIGSRRRSVPVPRGGVAAIGIAQVDGLAGGQREGVLGFEVHEVGSVVDEDRAGAGECSRIGGDVHLHVAVGQVQCLAAIDMQFAGADDRAVQIRVGADVDKPAHGVCQLPAEG